MKDELGQEKCMVELLMLTISYTGDNWDMIAAESLVILKKGGVIAYPTESFYALGVLASDEEAVRKLFEIKKRPADKPLPIVVADIDILSSVVKEIPDQARNLMRRYWPGPLTLIFEANDNVSELLTGGTGKIAARVPGHGAALDLARSLKLPLTATSANPSSLPPAEDADAVKKYFGSTIDLIIDSGKSPGGKPSTIVDVTVDPARTLREGSILLS